jgi:hypothetical protein
LVVQGKGYVDLYFYHRWAFSGDFCRMEHALILDGPAAFYQYLRVPGEDLIEVSIRRRSLV